MNKLKTALISLSCGLLGCLLGLLVWRAVMDYQDFQKMRVWVAQMQQLQAQQQTTVEKK